MNADNQSPLPPILPSPRRLYVVALAPLIGTVAATLVVGLHIVTAIAALAAALAAMARAGTFIIALQGSVNGSLFRRTFGMMYDRLLPARLQHWYLPLSAGVIAAAVVELLRSTFVLWRGHIPLSVRLLVGSFLLGALEGGFIILVAVASWAVVSTWLLRLRRPGRAA